MAKRMNKIGIFLPLDLQYGRQILMGASERARRHSGMEIHVLDADPSVENKKQGFIPDALLSFSVAEELDALRERIPAVVSLSNRETPSRGDAVISDDVEVGRMAALHLIRRGYRDLVYIGRAGHHYSAERLRGFQEQAEASGCTIFTFDLFGEDHESTLRRELRRLPARAGVFAANDIMARVVMEFTESPAQRIPLQFALLGVDDDPVQCSLCAVPLSSVVLNGFQVGVTAMERLLARLEDPNLPDEVVRIAPVRVETRQSTDLYALEDELAAEILETIDEHLAELSDVSDLVERLGHPRRTLESRFRKATHRTLAKELASVRVERARDLIRNGEDSIEDVARAVGLPDARMLWLLFKRHTGESPSDYRKRVRSG